VDFELTGAQREYRDRARVIAQDQLLPGYQARERDGRIEPELRRELGRLGLIAPELPAELGGQGADRLTTGVITEEIGRGDINVAYLQVVGIGLTEPHGGSDAGMPRLTAVHDGSDWVLDGVKSLSFGHDAAAVVVFGRTGPSTARGRDISAFLVPLDGPGVTREPYGDMGTKAVGRGAVHLAGVRIPGDHLLGEPGRGFGQVMQGFDFSRALIGLQCLGPAQQTVDETWRYVGTREAFGQPISLRRHRPVPAAARPVRLPDRAADRAAAARRARPADRRRHRPDLQTRHRPAVPRP
jgi:cyclohexanecarboxyl-CoA dehydrogenase